jgi:hypothetical protein
MAPPVTYGDKVRSYVANMFNSKPSLKTNDYSPYGIIKNNIVLPAIDSASAYRNKTSTQQGRSTSMNKFVTNAPVVQQNDFQLGKDYLDKME